MIVTVTLNAALDRTLTVPNFQRGQRHRASQVLTLAGGKGINIARALKRLDVPVVATGLAGGRTGTRIVEDRDMEGARVEAVAHRSDCSIVVAEGNAGGRGEARGILEAVAGAFPELELVAHEQETDAHAALVWIGSAADGEALKRDFQRLRGPGGEWNLRIEAKAAFVSLVGLGLSAREAARAEGALEKACRAERMVLVHRLAQQVDAGRLQDFGCDIHSCSPFAVGVLRPAQ